MTHDTSQFVIQDAPVVDLTSFFSEEDTTQNLQKFIDSIGKEKKQDEINYYWPTEIDPNAHEVIKWAIENSSSIFPNLVKEENSEI